MSLRLFTRSSFETNSSSSHSLVLRKLPENLDAALSSLRSSLESLIDGGYSGQYDFGWENTKYSLLDEKIVYLVVDNKGNDHKLGLMEEAIYEIITGDKENLLVDDEHVKSRKKIAKFFKNICDSDSYIDHQSIGTSYDVFDVGYKNELSEDDSTRRLVKDSFIAFLVSESYIQGGNDNDDYGYDYDY